jgi:hypothetical protein
MIQGLMHKLALIVAATIAATLLPIAPAQAGYIDTDRIHPILQIARKACPAVYGYLLSLGDNMSQEAMLRFLVVYAKTHELSAEEAYLLTEMCSIWAQGTEHKN